MGNQSLKFHQNLAEYFNIKPLYLDEPTQKEPNTRKLAEQPFQQTKAQLWDELFETLTDFRFLENKAKYISLTESNDRTTDIKMIYGGVFALQLDYSLALEQFPSTDEEMNSNYDSKMMSRLEQRILLSALLRIVKKETHILSVHPEVLWQQIYNRLQWSDTLFIHEGIAKLINTKLKHHAIYDTETWIHTLSSIQESDELILTLSGHLKGVTSCAISPDGKLICSVSSDHTLITWDAKSGIVLSKLYDQMQSANSYVSSSNKDTVGYTLNSSTYHVNGETRSKQNSLHGDEDGIISNRKVPPEYTMEVFAINNVLELHDNILGVSLGNLYGHTDTVTSFAISPDGNWIVSGSDDCSLKLWETEPFMKKREVLHATYNKGVGFLAGHSSQINCCSFSPDSKKIISAGDDQTLKIWDVESGLLINTLIGHTDSIWSCAFSPDNRKIVSGGTDQTVRLWKLDDHGRLSSMLILGKHDGNVTSCSFSPDSRTIIAETNSDDLLIWDTESGRLKLIVDDSGLLEARPPLEYGKIDVVVWEHLLSRRIKSYAFSPDSKRIVTISKDCSLRLWDINSGRLLKTFKAHTEMVHYCVFSPDGLSLLSVSSDMTLKIWCVKSGKVIRTLMGHTDKIRCCAWSPSGETIVSAGDDETLMVWETKTGKTIIKLSGHTKSVGCCKFSINNKWILSASEDGTIRLWDAQSGDIIKILYEYHEGFGSFDISGDGKAVVYRSNDFKLNLWKNNENSITANQKIKPHAFTRHNKLIRSCAFSPDGEKIISVSDDNTAKMWSVKRLIEEKTLLGHKVDIVFKITCCGFSPDGRVFLTGSTDQTVILRDVERIDKQVKIHNCGQVISCSFSPSGKTFISANLQGSLKLRSTRSGRFLKQIGPAWGGGLIFCAFSPNGKNIAIIPARSNCFYLIDAKTGEYDYNTEDKIFSGHKDTVLFCAFSPDGKKILSASKDRTLKLWDVESGEQVTELIGHTDVIWSCAFSPNGKLAISVSDDKTLRLWDIEYSTQKTVLPLLAHGMCSAFSPYGDKFCCGDSNGNLYILELKENYFNHPNSENIIGSNNLENKVLSQEPWWKFW